MPMRRDSGNRGSFVNYIAERLISSLNSSYLRHLIAGPFTSRDIPPHELREDDRETSLTAEGVSITSKRSMQFCCQIGVCSVKFVTVIASFNAVKALMLSPPSMRSRTAVRVSYCSEKGSPNQLKVESRLPSGECVLLCTD